MAKRGLFICFEGCDRVGKSTIAEDLYNYFKNIEVPVKLVCFPTREIRWKLSMKDLKAQTPRELMKLFYSDIWESFVCIEQDLKAGNIVIADRWFWSNIAYSVARGIKEEDAHAFHSGIPVPDFTFLLDMDPNDALKRPGKEPDPEEVPDFQEKVRAEYLKLANYGNVHMFTINAASPVEHIFHEVFTFILPWSIFDTFKTPCAMLRYKPDLSNQKQFLM